MRPNQVVAEKPLQRQNRAIQFLKTPLNREIRTVEIFVSARPQKEKIWKVAKRTLQNYNVP